MYEKAKLDEAKYFYSQMLTNFDDREKFRYNLSAFLTSARSVLQYTLEEAKGKNSGQVWYDKQLAASHTLPFFKDKRDVNIHTEPVHPTKHLTFTAMAKIGIRCSASVIVKDANGNIKSQSSTGTSQNDTEPQSLQETESTAVRWVFSDWAGPEDIMTLCQKYIDELGNLVKDGIKQGFLTG
jgi:hypothetical protein